MVDVSTGVEDWEVVADEESAEQAVAIIARATEAGDDNEDFMFPRWNQRMGWRWRIDDWAKRRRFLRQN